MDRITKFAFIFTDFIAYLMILGALVEVLLSPFMEAEYLLQSHRGWEPAWLGIVVNAVIAFTMGAGAFFYLKRKVTLFSCLGSIAAITSFIGISFYAGFGVIAAVLLMLIPCYLAKYNFQNSEQTKT